MVKFNKEIEKFPSLDEIENEVFTTKEKKKIRSEAKQRSQARRNLADQVSKAVAAYMANEGIGFNEFQRRLGVSTATASKLLKGDGNLTLETIANVSVLIGAEPHIAFTKRP